MDDDDEFGDLYTDVLHPSSAAAAAAAVARGADRIAIEVSPSHPPQTQAPAGAAAAAADELGGGGDDDGDDDWLLGREPPAVEAPANWDDDEEDGASTRTADAVGSYARDESGARVLEKGNNEGNGARVSQISEGGADVMEEDEGTGVQVDGGGDQLLKGKIEENTDVGDLDQVPAIPGLSSGPPAPAPFLGRDPKPSGSEDWDSDSEDDLQIVLNDDNYGMLGGLRDGRGGVEDGDEDEDGEEDLVIVTDEDQLHHHHLPAAEEQDWGEEGMQAGGDGERKDGGEGAQKGSGAGGAAASARIGYSNHSFHPPPHHSMFKYVRPGAGPISGVGSAIGPQGQIRPPLPSGPLAGRGRGDWRPPLGRGIGNAQKGFYPIGSWNNSSARAFGTGLDFTLPPHKTVFDIEIDSFEEKPWRYPGADVSDFFNFELDEDKWKEYCKHLEQMRLEATMQSKIRVYESGRSEQEFDPDLPPELAAAAGYHDISTDNGRLSKADNGQIDVNSQGRGPANVRPPLPTGRAIQVEGGYGERLPSIDTRPPRMRDSDAIIEIVLQDSVDDPVMYNGVLEQPEKDFQGERTKDSYEVKEDERNDASDYMDHINSSTNRRVPTRRAPLSSEGGDNALLPSETQDQYPPPNIKTKSPVNGGSSGAHHGGRLPQQISTARHSTSSGRKSNDAIRTQPTNSEGHDDHQDDLQLVENSEINEKSEVSPTIEDRFDENEDKLELHDSIEAGDDANSDIHQSSETLGEDNDLAHSGKKSKLSSRVEHSLAYDNDDEDMQRTSHSENSRAKSGSSREYHKRPELGEEVVQDERSRRLSDSKWRREGEESNFRRVDGQHHERSRTVPKGREDIYHPYSHRDLDRGRNFEMVREADVWQRREEALHGRRVKDEDIRREQSLEAGMRHRSKVRATDRTERDEDLHKKRVDDRDWRGSRPRERDDILMNRRETLDDSHTRERRMRRAREESNLRRKIYRIGLRKNPAEGRERGTMEWIRGGERIIQE
uniref:Pre-mRNA polyadenylation factor Fip1 domain-containing protein n=1 Tax=Ananas comosus var. bracteatus TaxID=296719 RepID=A0A6V7PPR0_ANACO|nr:unnamed protein product [Ananas comosus var. bracteatus]